MSRTSPALREERIQRIRSTGGTILVRPPATHQYRRTGLGWLRILGYLGILGCVIAVAADIGDIFLRPGENQLSTTISGYAAGRESWVMDVGLYAYAVGLGAVAIGLARLSAAATQRQSWWWWPGPLVLFLTAVDIVIIAAHNAYGEAMKGIFPHPAVIHAQLVYAFALLVLISAALLGPALRPFGRSWAWVGYGFAIIWVIIAPIFEVVPTDWNGLYERFVAAVLLIWTVELSLLLIRQRRYWPWL